MLKFALTIAACACVSLFANEKYYLEPEQISLSDQTIYVQLEGSVVEIDTLLVDQAGLYFEQKNARCLDCRQTLKPEHNCHRRLNPKNTCHRRLNPKNTCSVS